MARYIDADLLKERMYHEAFEKTTDLQRWDSGCWIRYKMFEKVIESIPTVDVVPHKKAKWIFADGEEPRFYECSRCMNMSKHTYRYCPCCGAQMDEGKELDYEVV